jgi:hypothetical protein
LRSKSSDRSSICSLKVLPSKHKIFLSFREVGGEEEDGRDFSEHVVVHESIVPASQPLQRKKEERNSMASSTPSMNEKQWSKLTILVEKASKLNFMTDKQTEIIGKCIERRETAVLSVLATSGGNFTKVSHFLS